ncbi:MAG TPA: hypothetical protein PKD52_04785 [Clostridiales bacterium]|nr:hypothetical protein [Clostridiales bacterium]
MLTSTWLFYGVFGMQEPYFLILKITVVLLLLSWLILAISKAIFGRAFYSNIWEGAFVFIISFPTFATLFTGSICALTYTGLFDQNMNILYVFEAAWFNISISYYLVLQLFFVIYLIHTFLRLWRYKRKPAALTD